MKVEPSHLPTINIFV